MASWKGNCNIHNVTLRKCIVSNKDINKCIILKNLSIYNLYSSRVIVCNRRFRTSGWMLVLPEFLQPLKINMKSKVNLF